MVHTRSGSKKSRNDGVEKIKERQIDRLNRIYYDVSSPAGFASVRKLERAVPRSERVKVLPWLREQPTYTIHKPGRKRYPRNFYMPTGPNKTWEIDLLSVENLADKNRPYRFILLCIDIFDRFAWARPLKDKTGEETARGIADILRTAGRKPEYLQGDAGKEFLNEDVEKLLEKHGIEYRVALGVHKASVVERFGRHIKDVLYRIFYYKGSYDYRKILQPVLERYNATVHSSTKIAPREVGDGDRFDIWFDNYIRKTRDVARPRYKRGQYVRLLINRSGSFGDRSYVQKYTEEVFKIYRVQTKHSTGVLPRPIYHVRDLEGEPIKGGLYAEELTPINFDPKRSDYKIEKVLGRRVNKETGERELLVKFLGYPRAMNAYVKASSVVNK